MTLRRNKCLPNRISHDHGNHKNCKGVFVLVQLSSTTSYTIPPVNLTTHIFFSVITMFKSFRNVHCSVGAVRPLLCLGILLLVGVEASPHPRSKDASILAFSSINDEPRQDYQTALSTAMELMSNVQLSLREEHRMLQQETNVTEPIVQTPDEVCALFNNQTVGLLTCQCSRFGFNETQVDCTYDVPQCSSDKSTCYTGSISQVINDFYQARVMTSCTTFTQSVVEMPDAETCIRVFPMEDGNFGTIESCSATFQPSGASEAKVCASCSICATDDTTATSRFSNSSTNPRITVDCCNLQTDVIQTCGPVDGRSGSAVPLFDIIPPEKMGMCTSGGVTPTGFFGAALMILWFTAFVTTVV